MRWLDANRPGWQCSLADQLSTGARWVLNGPPRCNAADHFLLISVVSTVEPATSA